MTDQNSQKQLGDALRDVLEAQHDAEGELREVRASRARREAQAKYQPGLLLFIVAAWGFIGYAWVARPAFVFGGAPSADLSASQREAKMRYAIYLQRARVDAYRATTGRLPESLRDVGAVEAGVQYERTTEASYEVSGSVDGTVLRLTDRMSADSFLGDALRQLPPPIQ
jgi:hypothetical protein